MPLAPPRIAIGLLALTLGCAAATPPPAADTAAAALADAAEAAPTAQTKDAAAQAEDAAVGQPDLPADAARAADIANDPRPIAEVLKVKEFALVANADLAIDPALGILLSRRHLLLALSATATGNDLNAAVALSGAELTGASPVARMVQLRLPPDATFGQLAAAADGLAALPGVVAVAKDVPMAPTDVPPPNPVPAGAPAGWAWEWGMPANADPNWGLEYIRAPLAWNVRDHLDLAAIAPLVAVLDSSFAAHPDLPLASDPTATGAHGTKVAGLIAAPWNGQFIDGLLPEAKLLLRHVGPGSAEVKAFVSTFGSALSAAVGLLGGGERPRVVNLSVGYNWASNCFADAGKTYRCDPHIGATIADQGCSPSQAAAVRKLIADQGKLFGMAVQAANKDGDMLFVASAGNDAGVPGAPTGGSFCPDPALSGAAKGLAKDFPQDLSSPAVWAASHDALASAHIIVAEALQPPADTDFASAHRAAFSSAKTDWGAHAVFAPGQAIGVLQTGAAPTVAYNDGTSFAAPLVAGAAAFLLAVEPDLTDAQLIELLTLPPYAQAMSGGGSLTEASLDLHGALVGIDAVAAKLGPTVGQWLCDFDDGSPDGFSRYDLATGAPTPADDHGDGTVDLRDFRRLRDNLLLVDGKLALPTGWQSNPKFDLNGDGAVKAALDESFPRSQWTETADSPILSPAAWKFGGKSLTVGAVLAAHYSEDAVQPLPGAAIGPLLAAGSADLHVDGAAWMAAKGVDHVELTFADAAGALPAPWAAYAKGFVGLYLGKSTTIFTVPLWAGGHSVRWRAAAADPWESLPVAPALAAGEDRSVKLANCQPPVAVLAPGNGFSSTYCLADPFTCACMDTCGKCPNAKVALDASASHNPDGSTTGLQFAWQVSKPANLTCVPAKLGPNAEPKNTMECMFGGSPTCTQLFGATVSVTVTVSNACGSSSAVRNMPINCKGNPPTATCPP